MRAFIDYGFGFEVNFCLVLCTVRARASVSEMELVLAIIIYLQARKSRENILKMTEVMLAHFAGSSKFLRTD